ncbi:hypothetical protein OAT18_04150 [Tenacibaculum sp.]|nr:hypothetical protein [Tenacibaculum sp.]
MRDLVLLLALTVVFISCTDNTEIIQENEKFETQLIDKDDDTHQGGDGGDTEEISED